MVCQDLKATLPGCDIRIDVENTIVVPTDRAISMALIGTELVTNAARNLGVRVAYLVNIFNPDIVVIGGGVEKSGEIFMDAIKETVKKFSFEEPAIIVKIVPTLLEDNSVVLGASALAAREVFIES